MLNTQLGISLDEFKKVSNNIVEELSDEVISQEEGAKELSDSFKESQKELSDIEDKIKNDEKAKEIKNGLKVAHTLGRIEELLSNEELGQDIKDTLLKQKALVEDTLTLDRLGKHNVGKKTLKKSLDILERGVYIKLYSDKKYSYPKVDVENTLKAFLPEKYKQHATYLTYLIYDFIAKTDLTKFAVYVSGLLKNVKYMGYDIDTEEQETFVNALTSICDKKLGK